MEASYLVLERGVGVEAALGDKEDLPLLLKGVPRLDHARHLLEAFAERVRWEVGGEAHIRGGDGERLARAQRVGQLLRPCLPEDRLVRPLAASEGDVADRLLELVLVLKGDDARLVEHDRCGLRESMGFERATLMTLQLVA